VLPRFAELPVRPGAPPGSSWGVFGDDDEIGTLNFVRPEDVAAAARLVRAGKVFALNLGLELPDPPLFGRKPVRHTLFEKYGGAALDEHLDDLYPQASTQWDGLRHFADPDHGFYNGAQLAELTGGGDRLGVHHWARRGIAARAVLLDVAGILDDEGASYDPLEFFPIGAELLARAAERQAVEIRQGDVLLIRTGWLGAYEQLGRPERERLAAAGRPAAPGLHGDDVPAFLWDNRIAAVAADNPALEATRCSGDASPLKLHVALIARLGMPLGELWRLDELAADCAADGVYDALLVSAPLNLRGGAGTPANALALK
jgi:Putative cyclase